MRGQDRFSETSDRQRPLQNGRQRRQPFPIDGSDQEVVATVHQDVGVGAYLFHLPVFGQPEGGDVAAGVLDHQDATQILDATDGRGDRSDHRPARSDQAVVQTVAANAELGKVQHPQRLVQHLQVRGAQHVDAAAGEGVGVVDVHCWPGDRRVVLPDIAGPPACEGTMLPDDVVGLQPGLAVRS